MRNVKYLTAVMQTRWRVNSSTTWYTSNSSHELEEKYRDDIVPGYRRGDGFRFPTNYRVHDIKVTSHAFSGCRVKLTPTSGTTYEHEGYSSSSASGNLLTTTYGCINIAQPVPNIPTNLRSRAEVKALLKMKNGDFNLALFLAELNKTVAFVVQTSILLRNGMRALRRGDVNFFLQWLKKNFKITPKKGDTRLTPGDIWLQYQYAVIPLMYDIYGAIHALNSKWSEYPPVLTVEAVALEPIPSPLGVTQTVKGMRFLSNATRGVKIGLAYSVDNNFLYGLSSLGLLNPMLLAWELLPYSFVFDWFIPVGRWLEALTATIGLQFVTGYRTNFVHIDSAELHYTPNFYWHHSGELPRLTATGRSMQRIVLTSFPTPKPYFDSMLSGAQLTSATALIAQIASKL